jgi:apolipoprotein N-acyltransferase
MLPYSNIFLVFALVLFCISAFGIPEPHRPRLVAAGLAFWVAAELVNHLPLR